MLRLTTGRSVFTVSPASVSGPRLSRPSAGLADLAGAPGDATASGQFPPLPHGHSSRSLRSRKQAKRCLPVPSSPSGASPMG
ncbi:hypothetical protein HEQ62_09620 [Haematospirillum jordaniae]|uniref:hypothetical protein n=1 Tax=Haematospirillum jordaniae TaxID=1549855 RepID=UPI0012E84DE6|nr:hypothetical protein [Haematospirillum jordaniae]NKD45794.1 hypothetical protein [Haematospirillum jordaniae]NKD57971.1 hypothetical protein [Haematospirillum jordaniae]NKD60030.1 hypothetical protein [Haematospirillum jordaniae]NKD67942.1 hypothetical protein [Haematospirillum jordaniae]NKD80035.1 hypothetical protein [Haematospirillum jordaniae]